MIEGLKVKALSVGIDPNTVWNVNGEIIRRIAPPGCDKENGRWSRSEEFIRSPWLKILAEEGWIPKIGEIFRIGSESYLRQEKINPYIHPWWWTKHQKRRAIEFSELLIQRLTKDNCPFFPIDPHLSNVVFIGARPIYVDLGSFSHIERDYVLDRIEDVKREVAVQIEKPDEWSSYNAKTLDWPNEPGNDEEKLLDQWFKQCNPSLLFDAAGGHGRLSRLATNHGAKAICFDSNADAVNQSFDRAKKLGVQVYSAFGKLENIQDDHPFKSDMVIASSITHHLFRQGMKWDWQASLWNRLGTEWLAVEFIDATDKDLGTWGLNVAEYNHEGFMQSLSGSWQLQSKGNPERTTRTWHLFKKLSPHHKGLLAG